MEENEVTQEETTNEEVVEESKKEVVEETQPEKKQTSFVKIREQKAKESLLKELGVKDIEEAKNKLANADEALKKVNQLEKKLEARDYETAYNNKVNKLTKLLEKENVFDAESLVNYVDIDEVELDNSGNIKDSMTIINQLKQRKPNYFGKEFIRTDNYNKSNATTVADPYKEDYENKNYNKVIATYLRNNKK